MRNGGVTTIKGGGGARWLGEVELGGESDEWEDEALDDYKFTIFQFFNPNHTFKKY
jgi:hypothetical protein